jgi:hypothetical protein
MVGELLRKEFISFLFWLHDTDTYGLVTGRTPQEIFEALDEHFDPYQCLLRELEDGRGASVSFSFERGDESAAAEDYSLSELIVEHACCETDGWFWFKDWFEANGGQVSEDEKKLMQRGVYEPDPLH